MNTAQLLDGLSVNPGDVELCGLSLDSRRVNSGEGFIALQGAVQHGICHASQAIANGAQAVIYEPNGVDQQAIAAMGVANIAVENLNQKLGEIAARFYQHPSTMLDVIGITGTNGKTTVSQLIAQALPQCGVIGTLGWGDVAELQSTVNTTPDALAVQQILQQLLTQGKRAVAMEVSSHGLQQGRVNAVRFKGAVFTNLSRDHLDYHGSMAEYLQAKLSLFQWKDLQFAVVNLDDACSSDVLESLPASVRRWGFSAQGNTVPAAECICAENVSLAADGIEFEVVWGEQRQAVKTLLVGRFNLENLLAVLCTQLAMGITFSDAVNRLADLKAIAGRMERLGGQGKPSVIVDYAHTPDALEKLLHAVKSQSRLCLVFGCGGDRDKGKRSEMGRIAEAWADQVIVTDDNPRTEQPAAIINDILSGCKSPNTIVIHDRNAAISTAIQQAGQDDWVVVAGKGHELYQEINGVKWPFNDRLIVQQALDAWSAL